MTFVTNTGKSDKPEHTPPRNLFRRWWIWLLAAGLLGLGAYTHLTKAEVTSGPASKRGPSSFPQSVAVSTAIARQGDINIYLNGLGSVTPLNTVTVKSRVDGQLMKVLFQEGQLVNEGSLLAEIDPRPYEVMLTQAEGQMARDQALLSNAKLDLERYKILVAEDSVSRQQYDTQKSLVHQYEGAIKLDQGQIDNARLQIIYSRITAPITGRIGLRLVDPGNIVHATDTSGIAVITQLQPIAVIFPIPEDSLPPVLARLKSKERLPVDAFNREQTQKLTSGHLLTVDNQIDPSTGTVRLKALFPNKENELFPNQFVNARLLLDVKRGTTIVPSTAIQRSPKGAFVYLVKADQTVAVQQVQLGPGEGDDMSVEEGIGPGDTVVVEGAEKLREGSKVEVKPQGTDSSRKGK